MILGITASCDALVTPIRERKSDLVEMEIPWLESMVDCLTAFCAVKSSRNLMTRYCGSDSISPGLVLMFAVAHVAVWSKMSTSRSSGVSERMV